jgi:hypothetical protein
VTADENADRQVSFRLRRLESAVQRNSTEDIKHEALETVGLLTRLMDERSRRRRAQMGDLARRLARPKGELDAAREEAGRDRLVVDPDDADESSPKLPE